MTANLNAAVLIVEDHTPLAETVGLYMENKGFTIDFARDGVTALHLATVNRYDVILLDIMLPGLNGFEVCHKLRNEAGIATPILMLTARDRLDDKLEGFREGADDYLVKPFDLPELEARVISLIRRERGEMDQKILQVGELEMNLKTMEVRRNNQRIKLTPTGLRILRILMRASPNIVSREQLEQELWGDLIPDSDTLRSHVYQVRKAIDKPFDRQLIHTLSGLGFKVSEK